tara:strand:+ start:712 stop:1758 length:1047 start_codon:yes stop_codon:yes gene_type:complete
MLIEVKGEKGNSIYQIVGTDKGLDYLRGTNPVGVVFSEYSRMSPLVWDTIRPILRENDGFAIFATTPWGQNHAYDLYRMAKDSDTWYASLLTVDDTKDENGRSIVSEDDVEEERQSGMSDEMIAQEFYSSFQAALPGAYFSKEMSAAELEGRITKVPYDPDLPVDTYWDLGVDDATSIFFAQSTSHETRIIDYYEGSGEGLIHYIRYLKDLEYVYGKHFAPHDINQREFSTGRSRRDTALTLGIDFTPGIKVDKSESIDSARRFIKRCYFDKEKCYAGINALMNYHKAWNDRTRNFSGPVHDWSSHAADAFMEMANSFYALVPMSQTMNHPTAQTDFDIFNAPSGNIF